MSRSTSATMTRIAQLLVLILVLVSSVRHASADAAADRAAVADAIGKLGASAEALGRTAKASEDRNVRKKFAPSATELGDDLAALARRARKDVPLAAIVKDAVAINKDATALVELADEADDKDERKSLRAQATLLQQGVAGLRKTLDAIAAKPDDGKRPAAERPTPIKPDAFKQLLATTEDANTDAEKLAVVRQAADGNHFTAAQVGALMALFNTEMPKVDAASYVWPRIVDQENGFVLYGKLELAGSKAELRRRIGK